ncbi:hypothetical protein AC579_1494 [Pseudocercospora musae]|uniref:Uncharacterized protein n=1 Tax=Pseudocercospora musae TaxID=113226 RepID=A0A139IJV0_9PEZI|nr:hypothetical protein AC579_1494 [Pseudocercospora musae]
MPSYLWCLTLRRPRHNAQCTPTQPAGSLGTDPTQPTSQSLIDLIATEKLTTSKAVLTSTGVTVRYHENGLFDFMGSDPADVVLSPRLDTAGQDDVQSTNILRHRPRRLRHNPQTKHLS